MQVINRLRSNRGSAGVAVLVIIFVVLAVIFAPLIAMWAVDAVFGTNLPVTLKSWFGALLLLMLLGKGSVTTNKS